MVNILGNEKIQFDEFGNLYLLKTISKDGQTEKIQPENATLPYLKEVTVQVIWVRTGYDETMRAKKWFGIQSLKIFIPKERQFKYHYLAYDKKAMSNVCVVVFDPAIHDGVYNRIAYDFCLQPSPTDSREVGWIKPIGKPKTITELKAKEMLQNKEVLGVFSDNGEIVKG
jgi:hypothetical protein